MVAELILVLVLVAYLWIVYEWKHPYVPSDEE